MNSLTCLIKGHLWHDHNIKKGWEKRFDGEPFYNTKITKWPTPFCLRCGKPNPNWTRHPSSNDTN